MAYSNNFKFEISLIEVIKDCLAILNFIDSSLILSLFLLFNYINDFSLNGFMQLQICLKKFLIFSLNP